MSNIKDFFNFGNSAIPNNFKIPINVPAPNILLNKEQILAYAEEDTFVEYAVKTPIFFSFIYDPIYDYSFRIFSNRNDRWVILDKDYDRLFVLGNTIEMKHELSTTFDVIVMLNLTTFGITNLSYRKFVFVSQNEILISNANVTTPTTEDNTMYILNIDNISITSIGVIDSNLSNIKYLFYDNLSDTAYGYCIDATNNYLIIKFDKTNNNFVSIIDVTTQLSDLNLTSMSFLNLDTNNNFYFLNNRNIYKIDIVNNSIINLTQSILSVAEIPLTYGKQGILDYNNILGTYINSTYNERMVIIEGRYIFYTSEALNDRYYLSFIFDINENKFYHLDDGAYYSSSSFVNCADYIKTANDVIVLNTHTNRRISYASLSKCLVYGNCRYATNILKGE